MDAAQVISRMCDIVMIRTFEQAVIERFAGHSRVPVINGLTNEYHPCQVLADIYTFLEHRGPIRGKTVAWIGDSDNVCNTWLQASEVLGFKVNVSTPPGYEDGLEKNAANVEFFADSARAAKGAHLVPTDVWTSMEEGSATFVTGGIVVDAKKRAPDEIRGTEIEGGETRTITTGDVLIVPAGTPHWFKVVPTPMTYYVVKAR